MLWTGFEVGRGRASECVMCPHCMAGVHPQPAENGSSEADCDYLCRFRIELMRVKQGEHVTWTNPIISSYVHIDAVEQFF